MLDVRHLLSFGVVIMKLENMLAIVVFTPLIIFTLMVVNPRTESLPNAEYQAALAEAIRAMPNETHKWARMK